jgi:hypothetical protein
MATCSHLPIKRQWEWHPCNFSLRACSPPATMNLIQGTITSATLSQHANFSLHEVFNCKSAIRHRDRVGFATEKSCIQISVQRPAILNEVSRCFPQAMPGLYYRFLPNPFKLIYSVIILTFSDVI